MHAKRVTGTLFLMILMAQTNWAVPFDSLGIENDESRVFVIHQVETKETLYSLAKRYRTTVAAIVENNEISGSNLALGSVLRIPWEHGLIHRVEEGETLFSIAQLYKVKVKDIKNQNKLPSDELQLGQELIISAKLPNTADTPITTKSRTGSFHVVGQKETLYSISRRYEVELGDLKSWNGLTNNQVQSGDTLWLNGVNSSATAEPTISAIPATATEEVTQIEESDHQPVTTSIVGPPTADILPVKETGIAAVIDGNSDTQKYLALHPTAPVGTIMRVRNEMTNLSVFVRVVGKLPKIGANNNVLIRLSPAAQQALGALDNKFRVELSYMPSQ